MDISHHHNEHNDILHLIERKIWLLFSKDQHSLGEFLLLYLIVFFCLFCMLIIFETV